MGVNRPQYEIRSDQYDANWDEVTVTHFTGDVEDQMRNLFYGVKSRISTAPKVVRVYLVDKNGKTIASSEDES